MTETQKRVLLATMPWLAMAGLLLLQADVTANNAEDRELLRRFRLFGPPGIMFFEPGGKEIADARVIGFQDARRFAATLDRALAR